MTEYVEVIVYFQRRPLPVGLLRESKGPALEGVNDN